ncbi:hypothetical protein FTO74_14320 [Granulicella sp. WH15]|uniref:hypothetical protein n=1 Tax=Granulicella sp. WH15 TaxID=2602070 RepID=UPI0013679A82|nr:hypothetical protein [Granulicella sp. WH15]QHN04407.1 hypothetical protein FTO74_14320 [Granulicella sp. WH15]
MPRKKIPIAGPGRWRIWTEEELAFLRRAFATTTNAKIATKLGRTAKSIGYAAGNLGLTKSAEHRSEQSHRVAIHTARTSEEMAAIGSIGGKIGGKARAEALTPAARKKIAKNAVDTRWAKKD